MTRFPGDRTAQLFMQEYDTFVFSSEYLWFSSVPMCVIRGVERKCVIRTWIYIHLLDLKILSPVFSKVCKLSGEHSVVHFNKKLKNMLYWAHNFKTTSVSYFHSVMQIGHNCFIVVLEFETKLKQYIQKTQYSSHLYRNSFFPSTSFKILQRLLNEENEIRNAH